VRGDSTWSKVLAQLAKPDLVILDDCGLATPNAEQRRDLLDILDRLVHNAYTIHLKGESMRKKTSELD
jgi:DNA replication protein DnaC